jgi:hypothetical protein
MPRKTQAGRSDDATTSHGAGKTQEPKRKSRNARAKTQEPKRKSQNARAETQEPKRKSPNAAVGFMKYSSARAAPPEV